VQERVTKKEDQEMSNDFDKAMDELQASIIKDARKIYSEKVIERWLNPTYMGEIENPQGYGKVTGVCGDTVHLRAVRRSSRGKHPLCTSGIGYPESLFDRLHSIQKSAVEEAI